VNFSFDERQLEFRSQMRAFCENECDASAVREAWSSEFGWSKSRWSALSEMGVVGLTAPEDCGGLGLGFVDLVLLLEEAGRACLPEPLTETTALAAPMLADIRAINPEKSDFWLTRIASGDAVAAVGVSWGDGAPDAVPYASGADLMVLESRTGSSLEIHAVEASDVAQRVLSSLDGTRRVSKLSWTASERSLLAAGEDAERSLGRSRDRACVASGAVLLGLAEHMIQMAAAYAVERRQFGKPIGSFQAVKHHLANALVRLEFSRPLVYRAAWSLDSRDADASVHASMAKAQASDAAALAARTALQVHGAIGYTWEHDLHLWMKRAWALGASWGDGAHHRARVLKAVSDRSQGA
jgi:alkylation response protein AidB-like acyl-CoA dehydrogenase